ncbi:MAG: hypothetical protein HFF39_00955 [Lawsonibacter sp.]|nr:hypothetical protein [Lawsonibacter sp.]
MKQGNALIRFVILMMTAALLCYLGVYVWQGMTDPFTTTYAYAFTASDGVEAAGWLVREEQVFPTQTGIVDVTRGEGEKVGAGQSVALVHRDSQALALQEEMNALNGEISVLDFALGQGDAGASTARLDEDILQALVQLRGTSAAGDYTQLERQVLTVKSRVLKRDYTYGQGLNLEDLTRRRQELVEQYQLLRSQSGRSTSYVTASQPGTFSALVDGYEYVLTPESVFELTPSQLDVLPSLRQNAESTPGKLVTSGRWYFAAALPREAARRLSQEKSIIAAFSGDLNLDVTMRVEQVGPEEDGRCAVVLSSTRNLAETILLREQQVELVFRYYTGLRVPKTALRMQTATVTDKSTQEETQVSTLGLYTVTNGKAEFKAVEILTEGPDHYVVRSADQGSRALRPGDEVIVRATNLYDGKLLQY